MESLDPVLLARLQFAANVTFHFIFPALTIALGWVLLFFKLAYAHTGKLYWMENYFFYTKIFALSFALGVVSGITMSFQFGTNWPRFMETVGNVAGPLLAYEVLTAFFLEATFLGVMLFGFRKVPDKLHTIATLLVALGTTLSAFWILVLNSWMHTPVGFEMLPTGLNGAWQAHPTDWLAIVFNPSMPYRMAHTLLASGITAAFVVAGLAAYRWLRDDRSQAVRAALKTGVTLAAVLLPLQILVGHAHGVNTLEYQPAKIAAMEANWNTQARAPLVVFAHPNEATRTNDYALEIPGLASWFVTGSVNGVVPGLNDYVGNHPPVSPVFWGFRLMVGMGLLMLAASWVGAYWLWCRKDGQPPRWLAQGLLLMFGSGWVATLSGWYVTEVGRQPWLVSGVLRTADAVGPVHADTIALTLAGYLITYALLLVAYFSTLFYLARHAKDAKTPTLPSWSYHQPKKA
ncbi:MAG: cytochrome ubiquinol oxidase subunit I [Alphaproteobacteria bacterium]|jgi:cytochrome d ubiquinol oxidase subunit I|nr:cytochrome ubiquinol oxidase subunit I [Alphaproteobacteria bacterium]